MKLLRIVPLALAVTFTSAAFADTPKKDASSDKGGTTKDAPKGDSKEAPKTPVKTPIKDTSKGDSKTPAK